MVICELSLCILGAATFNHTSLEEPYYVGKGKTARFNWTYSVDNRDVEFELFSPVWYFNNKFIVIGRDNSFLEWRFLIDNISCPERLLKPTVRVSRKDQATLVIENVITADSGVYGCILDRESTNDDPTDTVELVVTGMLIVKYKYLI